MEDYLAQQISECEPITSQFVDDQGDPRPFESWFFESSSLGIGPNLPVPQRPYIVWNEGDDFVHQVVRNTSNARDRTFRIYVYDYKGDFSRINSILEALRDLVKQMAPFTTEDGVRCSDSLWVGISGRFLDDGYDSSTRFGTARFTVSH